MYGFFKIALLMCTCLTCLCIGDTSVEFYCTETVWSLVLALFRAVVPSGKFSRCVAFTFASSFPIVCVNCVFCLGLRALHVT